MMQSSIVSNILTLRYDPFQSSSLPKLDWKNFEPNQEITLEFIENKVKQYLEDNISDKTNSITISLSGGIDSSLILGYIKKFYPEKNIHAVSVKFSDSIDETQNAKKIAQHFDVEHESISVENYLEILPSAISITKMPFWDNHWYYVAKFASTKSNFLASGDGGDEIFAGYVFRYKKFLSLINQKSSPTERIHAYLSSHERDWVPDQEKLFGKQANFSWENIYQILLPYFDNSLEPLNQVLLADYNGKLLYNFSIVNNSINKNFNLQAITPLLSLELVNCLPHVHHAQKYDISSNIGKIHLRKLLEKFNLSSLISQNKLGFSVNTISLWKNFGKKICDYYFDNGRIFEDGWISKEWVQKYLNNSDLDVRYVNKFLGILALEIWYRIFITHELDSDSKLLF